LGPKACLEEKKKKERKKERKKEEKKPLACADNQATFH
jgi:hypothetical protein